MLPEMLQGLSPIPPKTPFSGTHYAKEAIKGGVLHGDKRGMTGEGEESDRVYLPPRGAPAAIHIYEDNGQVFGKHPQILSRPHAYKVEGNFNLANIEDEPEWGRAKEAGKQLALSNGADEKTAEGVSRNEAEWGIKNLGYDGYRSKNSPGSVVLFGSHPAKSLDKVEKEKASLQTPSESVSQAPNSPNIQTPPQAQIKYPMERVEEHEKFTDMSDPANLAEPYQKLFGIIPRNSAEHEALTQASNQV